MQRTVGSSVFCRHGFLHTELKHPCLRPDVFVGQSIYGGGVQYGLYVLNEHPVCVCVCLSTSIGDRRVLVQGYQRRVQQHRVHVLRDDAVVRRFYPRLVLVDCGREADARFTSHHHC